MMTRLAASNYIWTHPEDFLPFLPSSGGEDGIGATDTGFMTPKEFEKYCADIRDTGVWGGEPEILALSRAYNIPIHVVQCGSPPVVVHNPAGAPVDGDVRNKNAVRISYHRKMYGLGEVGLILLICYSTSNIII
jgi:OTU domain-containing protein 6